MPKYYTPKAAIRFANQDAVAFKKLAMTVETVLHCVSDHGLKETFYSGVIRYRLVDWKRYTVIWLYGLSTETSNQDFVQPSVSDVWFPTYVENRRVTSPSAPDAGYITGSNFVPGMDINFGDLDVLSTTVISRNHIYMQPPVWPGEQANVPITAINLLENRSGTNSDLFSYEYRPTVTSQSQTGSYIDGGVPIEIGGAYLKDRSNVSLSSGTGTWWSNNFTFDSPTRAAFFTPAVPATGVYTFNVRSPSRLTSVQNVHLTVSYHRPEIRALLPYAFGSIAGSTPITIVGSYFDSGSTVFFDSTGVLSQSVPTSTTIHVLTPPHGTGTINVVVSNSLDTQYSLPFSYTYVIPLPTITDARFSGTTDATQKTGSAGSTLYITGTNFTGSDAGMTVTQVSLISGAFVSASTVFVFNGPTEIQYDIGILTPGSRYDIEVSNSVGTAYLSQAFEYQDLPVVLSIFPTSGTILGNLPVAVNGRPFYPAGASLVKFGGVLGSAQTYYNPTQISAVTPAAATEDGGRVEVSVQNFGSLEGGLPNAFEYVPFPTASSVSSPTGLGRVAAETGGTLYLNGIRFMSATVDGALGTMIRTDFESSINPSFINDTRLAFNVLPHAAAFCGLTATNRNIATGTPLTAAFEYVNTPTLTSLTPSAVVYNAGTTVNAVGTNFINSTDTKVFVGGTQAVTTVTSPTALSFVVPSLAINSYNVTVVNRATTVSNARTLQLIPQPSITSLSVTQGVNTGGTSVLVNGTGFMPGMTAVFSGLSFPGGGTLAVTYISPTQFSFTTPATAAGVRGYANLTISVLGITAAAFSAFFYEVRPVITSLSPTTALSAGSTVITMLGSGFVNGVTVVDIDNVTVAATVNSTTQITFTAPAHAVGAVTVKVTNTFLNSTIGTLSYAALPPPTILLIQVGSVLCNTAGQAKWSTAGGAAHPEPWVADKLLGTNFTAADVITVIPTDGGASMTPAVTFVNSTELWFSMPAYANSAQGYITVSNTNGTSNYAIFYWWRTPTVSSITPNIGKYSDTNALTVNGSNFVNGQTFVTDGIRQWTATVYSPTSLAFSLPPTWNVSTDRSVKDLWVANSTSQGGEAQVYTNLFMTVNPARVTLIDPNTALTNGTTYLNTYANDNTYMATQLHIYQFDPGTGIWTDLGLTNLAGTYVADKRLAAAHAAGINYRAFGYTANNGLQVIGDGLSFTYIAAAPLYVTITNQTSVKDMPRVPGYVGTPTVITAPYLYAYPNGGVAPYTMALEFVQNIAGPGEVQLPIQLAATPPGPGQYWTARGYGGVYYDGANIWRDDEYRWKLTDSVGTIAYSTPVRIAYQIYENTGDGPSCIVPSTPILMAGNITMQAGDIKVGDIVLTYPETMDTRTLIEARVVGASSEQNRTVRVEFTDGRLLRCSYNHRVATKDGWTEAEKLYPGLLVSGQIPGTVKEVIPDGVREVIKLTVPGAKTYISDGLLSHNAKILTP